MKHPMKLLMRMSLMLLLTASGLLLSRSQALAGGGFVSVHVDAITLVALAPVGTPWHTQLVMQANGVYHSAYPLPVNPIPDCPEHGTNAPHYCNNPDYSVNWNPSLEDADAAVATNIQVEGTGNLTPRQAILPRVEMPLIDRGLPFSQLQFPDWTNVGVIMNNEQWLQEHGNDPNWMLVPLPTNIPRWAVFTRSVTEIAVPQALQIATNSPDNMDYQIINLDDEDALYQQILSLPSNFAMDEAPSAAASEATKQAGSAAAPSLQMRTWPNPTSGSLKVHLQGMDGGSAVYFVLDVRGEVVMQQAAVDGETLLDLSGYAAGTYFLQARTADAVVATAKVILAH